MVVKVAYLGPDGSYTHQSKAALARFSDSANNLDPVRTIPAIFDAVQSGDAAYGIVPFENSSNGAVLTTLDLLATLDPIHPDITIIDEVFVNVRHCLLGHKSALGSAGHTLDLSSIHTLYTHPQAWGQCTRFLSTHFSKAERLDTTSTSAAARKVATSNDKGGKVAIASSLAAKVHGLDVLVDAIEDRGDNQTRFLVIARRNAEMIRCKDADQAGNSSSQNASQADVLSGGGKTTKTLVHFRVASHENPGALADALAVFKHHSLNLTSFYTRPDHGPAVMTTEASTEGIRDGAATQASDSRPVPAGRNGRWRYIFFVEFGSSRPDARDVRDGRGTIHAALQELQGVTKSLRVVGTW